MSIGASKHHLTALPGGSAKNGPGGPACSYVLTVATRTKKNKPSSA